MSTPQSPFGDKAEQTYDAMMHALNRGVRIQVLREALAEARASRETGLEEALRQLVSAFDAVAFYSVGNFQTLDLEDYELLDDAVDQAARLLAALTPEDPR